MNRREACAAAAAFAMLGGLLDPLGAQDVAAGNADAETMAHSRVYHFDHMPVTHYPNGGWGRAVVKGTLPTGEYVECHETMLPAGKMPHPPHHHRNTEFVLIRQGKLEFLNDGKPEPAGPGDVIYTASNVEHGLRNVGETEALYFVVSVSHGQG